MQNAEREPVPGAATWRQMEGRLGRFALRYGRGQVHVFGQRFTRKNVFRPKNGPVPNWP